MNQPANWDYRDTSVGIAGWRTQQDELHAAFVNLVRPLDAEQLTWQPAPEKWSLGSIIAHLDATNRELLRQLRYTIGAAQARDLRGEPPFTYGWLGRWFLDEIAPPAKRSMRAPRLYAPPEPNTIEKQPLLSEFDRLHAELLEALDDAEGLHLGKVKMRSPAFWLLRVSLGIWLASIPAHAARHFEQARAVRESPGFPRG